MLLISLQLPAEPRTLPTCVLHYERARKSVRISGNVHLPASKKTSAGMKVYQLLIHAVLLTGFGSSLDESGIHPRDECSNPVRDSCTFLCRLP